jgi:hypothetical protein
MAKAESAHTTIASDLSSPARGGVQFTKERISFKSAGAVSKARQLRNLFEAGMDFETALGCLGLSERAEEFRGCWAAWESAFG